MAMKTGKSAVFVTVAVSALVGGCANFSGKVDNWWECATAGAIVGGAGGALDSQDSALWGALGGALIGGSICALTQTNERAGVVAPEPVAPLPQCEHIVPGWDVELHGCPPDTDGDGVPDPLDMCPDTLSGESVDSMGCPILESAMVEAVHFAFSSFELSAEARDILDLEVGLIKRYPSAQVVLTGYTDTTGPFNFNNKLSQDRALSVRDYLVSQGVDTSRITTRGDGPSDPVESNDTMQGRLMNRRVQIEIKNFE